MAQPDRIQRAFRDNFAARLFVHFCFVIIRLIAKSLKMPFPSKVTNMVAAAASNDEENINKCRWRTAFGWYLNGLWP